MVHILIKNCNTRLPSFSLFSAAHAYSIIRKEAVFMPTSTQCCLLPCVCETASLHFNRHCAPVCLSDPVPCDASLCSAFLSALPALQDLTLCPAHAGHGCKLTAALHLPVSLCFSHRCEQLTRSGCISLPIQLILRTKPTASLQYIPAAELCIRDLFPQNGSLCAEFDLQLCVYAVRLQPVTLPLPCPEPPDCAPFFHLPLYPELPHHKM